MSPTIVPSAQPMPYTQLSVRTALFTLSALAIVASACVTTDLHFKRGNATSGLNDVLCDIAQSKSHRRRMKA